MTGFKKATKTQSRARVAFVGPAGSGKTYSALAVAEALVPDGRVAVIDTERGSASKYADLFAFDVLELERFHPEEYVKAIALAEAEGYSVLVIDSLSHAWMGKEGALELVDKAQAREKNKFAAWRDVTPLHNRLVDAMIGARLHVLVTMRAKTEWVLEENERGKKVPKKIGLAPVQRDGLEYEFDVVGDLDQENTYVVSKTRCPALAGAVIKKPGADFAAALRVWLTDGVPATEPEPVVIDSNTPIAWSDRFTDKTLADLTQKQLDWMLADGRTFGTPRETIAWQSAAQKEIERRQIPAEQREELSDVPGAVQREIDEANRTGERLAGKGAA